MHLLIAMPLLVGVPGLFDALSGGLPALDKGLKRIRSRDDLGGG